MKLGIVFRVQPDRSTTSLCNPLATNVGVTLHVLSEPHPDKITTPAQQDIHTVTGPYESPHPYPETTMGNNLIN